MHNKKRILIILFLVSSIVVIGIWYFLKERIAQGNGLIRTSGTVEAVEVLISSEQSGIVEEVFTEKGDSIHVGDALFFLDDELMQTQRLRTVSAYDSASANLISTETNLDMAEASLRSAEVNLEVATANSKVELIAAQHNLDELYDTVEVTRGEALQNVAAANRAVREAQYRLDNFSVPNDQQDLTAMQAIEIMKEKLDEARNNFEPYKYESSGNETRKELKDALDEAQSDYDAALRRLEYQTTLAKAQAQLDQAMEDLLVLKEGPDPEDIELLESRIAAIKLAPKQARALVDQNSVVLTQAQAQVDYSRTLVQQAQAELDVIEAQISKSKIYSPISGIVLSKNIQPGEVIQIGAPVITIGQLDQITITVFVPEDQYGQINIGDEAAVTVNSFPGKIFRAEVIYIADQANFTPRNVQTSEGRRTTVFAIQLKMENVQGVLKPGMPADVCFGCL